MSEEQPTFKVTDRRLFNADGTPREIEREERPSASEPSAPASVETNTAAPPAPSAEASRRDAEAEVGAASTSTAASATLDDLRGDELPPDDYLEEEIPDAHDPASFINFLMSLASNAAASLGMMEHPATGQRGVDLPLAKHWIDVLGMLERKTRGNLTRQEAQIFEGLLADLRLQYVSLTKAAAAQTPRGFSGRDIIGGK